MLFGAQRMTVVGAWQKRTKTARSLQLLLLGVLLLLSRGQGVCLCGGRQLLPLLLAVLQHSTRLASQGRTWAQHPALTGGLSSRSGSRCRAMQPGQQPRQAWLEQLVLATLVQAGMQGQHQVGGVHPCWHWTALKGELISSCSSRQLIGHLPLHLGVREKCWTSPSPRLHHHLQLVQASVGRPGLMASARALWCGTAGLSTLSLVGLLPSTAPHTIS